jgi:hypothetical protein
MRYQSAAALRAALEARLQGEARARGVRLDRLRRLVVFERMLVRLEVASPGGWVLKGGMALEVRLREGARTTKDLDLAARERLVSADAVLAMMVGLLATDPDGDGFKFEVGRPAPLAEDEAGRGAWRLAVRAMLAGREFAAVRADVAARPDELAATERLPLPNLLAFAGLPSREVEAVAAPQHFAEKLHALTRPYGDRQNTRVRDLVDLILLIERARLDPGRTLAATRWVFAVRSTHELPGTLPDPPAFWAGTYADLAQELGTGAATVGDAMACLRSFWMDARG